MVFCKDYKIVYIEQLAIIESLINRIHYAYDSISAISSEFQSLPPPNNNNIKKNPSPVEWKLYLQEYLRLFAVSPKLLLHEGKCPRDT